MAYGVTGDGFKKKRLADIKTEIESELQTAFGDNISLIPQSVFGQLVGIMSERESLLWDEMENVYNAFYPSTAQGSALSELVLLNAIERKPATKSIAMVICTGTDGTIIPAGTIVKTSDTGKKFEFNEDYTIDNSTDAAVTAIDYGAVEAVAGTLTVIDTPISGWDSVTNSSDATIGREIETDVELRKRRKISVGADAQNLTDSTQSQLLNFDSVSDVIVIDNKTNTTDINGVPPHEFLCVVNGGINADIASIIWANTPQGIQSYGDITVQTPDSQGNPQDVKFSRPSSRDIYFVINITTNSDFPLAGDDDIKANIVQYGLDNFGIGDDVIQSRFFTPINRVAGIIDIEIFIGFTGLPTNSSNLSIAKTEISSYDTTLITVNIT